MQYFAYVRQYSIFVQFTPEKRMHVHGKTHRKIIFSEKADAKKSTVLPAALPHIKTIEHAAPFRIPLKKT